MLGNIEREDPIGDLLTAQHNGEDTASHVIKVLKALGQCENAAAIIASLDRNITYAEAIAVTGIQSQVNGYED